jgi:hypothetical protein
MIDAWISEDDPTDQNGDTTVVRVDGENPAPEEDFILLKWDLSSAVTSIPANAIVQRASIIANITDNSAGQNYQIYSLLPDRLAADPDGWVENQVTFQIPKLGADWQTDGARGAMDRGTTSLGSFGFGAAVPARVAFPLNGTGVNLVDEWLAGTVKNNGFLIGDTPGGTLSNGMEISSSEATSAACAPGSPGTACQRPVFFIAYTTPPTTDPTPPTNPTGVATSDNGASRISLTWFAATDPESGIDHYNVYRDGELIGTTLARNLHRRNGDPRPDVFLRRIRRQRSACRRRAECTGRAHDRRRHDRSHAGAVHS